MTAGPPLCLRHTDWLEHRLIVSGPADTLAVFQRAAAGAGVVPWFLDGERIEEDLFHRMATATPRTLSIEGARILAGQLRAAMERRHARAVAQVGRSCACPLDLHALVPVPSDVLRLGPDHPDALAWLWEYWGTTEPLRHVAAGSASPRGERAINDPSFRVGFWAADWTPWRALATIAAAWPALRFDMRPLYEAAP